MSTVGPVATTSSEKKEADSSHTFKEYMKRADDKSSIWFYFLREEKGQLAKCKECQKILKIGAGSTTPLHNHLRIIHKGKVEEHKSTAIGVPPPNKKPKKIESYFQAKEKSLAVTLSRMIAKDGLSFSIFCTSEDLRAAICSMEFSEALPKSPTSIRVIVMKYASLIREKHRDEIIKAKSSGTKFCTCFDEWSSTANRRFMNIILKEAQLFWNLGLVRIKGSMTAEIGIKMVQEKLELYGLSLEQDIVSIITDGTSVMTRMGFLSPTIQQLCLAHGIQLAVTDVLYRKIREEDNNQAVTEAADDENEILSDNEDSAFRVDANGSDRDAENVDVTHNTVGPLIIKIRKIVKLFKRSPLKNETLQKHVKADFGKELQLILDSKTRWNSLCDMIERFLRLKDCIKKSLIDIKENIILEECEMNGISELVEALGPLKVTVEALCRRDANLLTADAALNFAIGKLEELNSGISQELAQSFRKRVLERRTDISGVLQYLHTGNLEIDEEYDEDLFKIPPKAKIASILRDLLSRLATSEDQAIEENLNAAELENDANQPKKKTALVDELNRALHTIDSRAHMEKCQPNTTLLSTIRKEMNLFEAGGARGHHLQIAFGHIKTISPTSVESERAFSSAGYLCNKIRSSFRDDTLDELCFLRSHFRVSDSNK